VGPRSVAEPAAQTREKEGREDVDALHGRIQDFFESSMEEADFVIPYDQQGKVALLHERCRVLTERYEEDGTHVRVRAPESTLSALRSEL
jgi:GTP-binding protein HflX